LMDELSSKFHNDMSILAADKTAIGADGVATKISKIAVNRPASLAVAIAGFTQEHQYLPKLDMATNIDVYIAEIRRHMDHYLSIHDRQGLKNLTQFHKNEGIASFFDANLKEFHSYKYLFSPIRFVVHLQSFRLELNALLT
ncbi:TPA: hypothetical protein L5D75_006830, partial [Pseudomonas aeruginosa]|nr:hypothetical protein [Pseudomonas aeruginosa]